MQENKNLTIAIIPAKGKSSGIPGKLLRKIEDTNTRVIDYTVTSAILSSEIDHTYLVTDSPEISAHVNSTLIAVDREIFHIVSRPAYLSSEFAQVDDVVWWFLIDYLEKEKTIPGRVVVLQPTSLFRSHQDIDEALKIFDIVNPEPTSWEEKQVSVFSGTSCKKFAYAPTGITAKPISHSPSRRKGRQFYDTDDMLVMENGAIYIATGKGILENKTFRIEPMTPFLMDDMTSLEIDEPLDFIIASVLAKEALAHQKE